jgi:hypothetical protein
MASAKQPPPPLPPDAQAHVERLPPWLRDVAAGAFAATTQTPAAVAKADRERAETDRLANFQRLVGIAGGALRGDLGKSKEAQDCQEAIRRVLAGRAPHEAEVATLVLCESIVREAKERIQKARRPPPAGRGAP